MFTEYLFWQAAKKAKKDLLDESDEEDIAEERSLGPYSDISDVAEEEEQNKSEDNGDDDYEEEEDAESARSSSSGEYITIKKKKKKTVQEPPKAKDAKKVSTPGTSKKK